MVPVYLLANGGRSLAEGDVIDEASRAETDREGKQGGPREGTSQLLEGDRIRDRDVVDLRQWLGSNLILDELPHRSGGDQRVGAD